MKRLNLTVCIVLLLSLFPLNFAQASTINTNLDITVYQNTITNIDFVSVNEGMVYFPLNTTVSTRAIRHAKYKDYKYEQFEDSQLTKATARVTGFAAKCPGYYLTRTYSDTEAKSQVGFIKYYIPKSVFTQNGIDVSQCSQVFEPPANATSPVQTIHPTNPNPTATEPPESQNTTPAQTNPSFVMPPTPAPAPIVPQPTPAPIVPADVCGNNNPVSTTKYKGMYPVGMINEGTGHTGDPIRTNIYIPCDTNDDALMYVQLTGVGHTIQACDSIHMTTIANEFADKVGAINANGTLTGSNGYYKSQTIPIYRSLPQTGIVLEEMTRSSTETTCKVKYDSTAVTEDTSGNDRYSCPTGQTLVNVNQCQSDYEEFETNIDSCSFSEKSCVAEFMPRFIDYDNTTTPTVPTYPNEPTYPDNPDVSELPACYCENLAEWGGHEMGFMCCVFECPGLAEIIGDFKNFLAFNLVGTATAPEIPQMPAPEMPNVFDGMRSVDEKTLDPITTQEDPELETNSFTADDVKEAADEIEFREDPTGGFNIVNPIETLDENLSNPPTTELPTEKYPSLSNNNANVEDKVQKPSYNKNQVQQPSYNSNAQQPNYNDNVNFPKLNRGSKQ